MWSPSMNHVGERSAQNTRLAAVAIDKDKGSQATLKWAVDNLLGKGQTVILVHVRAKQSETGPNQIPEVDVAGDPQLKELFLPFRVFCTRKDIQCHNVVLEDNDISRAIIEFIKRTGIDIMVVGAGAKASFFRFKAKDIPSTVLKNAPEFCTVYAIHKGKVSTTRPATRAAPSFVSPLRSQLILSQTQSRSSAASDAPPPMPYSNSSRSSISGRSGPEPPSLLRQNEGSIKSPFTHRRAPNGKAYELSEPESDISFVSSRRNSDVFPTFESFDGGVTPPRHSAGCLTPPRLSGFSDLDYQGFDSWQHGRKSMDMLSPLSGENDMLFSSGQTMEDVESEMRRLKMELKQTMDMYSNACKEALTEREKTKELQRWKMEEQKRIEGAQMAEDGATSFEARSMTAMAHAEATQRIAELEAQKRINAEMAALKEEEEEISVPECRYRKYTIEEIEVATEYFSKSRKIGEGGYGPVYKCYLDHTPCAVKVLRPDATQGRSQFNQEVEILSCIRHPNMVLLLGACPEYGCLVYEYMSNGSLEDRLFRCGNTPPLSWQTRFTIAAEIATGLLFLHQTKPEPLVHRDLKPANILLDRNYVSKISDVGLARLVPPSVADNVTQYRMTATAGTFCYIDPEYQQTGMLGVKSDIYSLGIIFLQILTGKPPMGLSHHVEKALEEGTLDKMLDQSVADWPVTEATGLAKLAIQCAELRRKDRPDLSKVVLPYLNELRELAEDAMYNSAQCSPITLAW